jgi:hypothetical protein
MIYKNGVSMIATKYLTINVEIIIPPAYSIGKIPTNPNPIVTRTVSTN